MNDSQGSNRRPVTGQGHPCLFLLLSLFTKIFAERNSSEALFFKDLLPVPIHFYVTSK
jgi:hypothetical protein